MANTPNTTPAAPATPAPAKPLSGSHDPFVELAHLVKRLAHHVHTFVKNKDSHLAPETEKTLAAAEALTQHPIVQQAAKHAADDAAEEAAEKVKAAAAPIPAAPGAPAA